MEAISQKEMVDLFKSHLGIDRKHYRKFGAFKYERTSVQQEVVTGINGEVETKNIANEGDYILTGSKGEKYVLKENKFKDRYTVVEEFSEGHGIAEATGECYASVFNGRPFKFMATWGEQMICNPGDYLVTTSQDVPEVYRVEKSAFEATYKLV